tara:strand:+ start:1572 stop:2279 length:708 start_codon:yes stop_codon:yes gene_type:complete
MKIDIIIPVYNEEDTILKILKKIKKVEENYNYDFNVIVINDGSSDNTHQILSQNPELYNKLINNKINRGKGNAFKLGIKEIKGEIVIMQDADLEYDPNDYPKLIKPFNDFQADVVFGSRFLANDGHRVLYFWHMVANKLITLTSNIFSNLNLTDIETGYKLFKSNILKDIKFTENKFGIEVEITHKIANFMPKLKIFEVGITYQGRTYQEGKKIGLKDAFAALFCIIKYGLFKIN